MNLKLCEVVCDCDKLSLDTIKLALDRPCVWHYAYIMHDKDDTRPHWHIAIRFTDSQNTKYIGKWFGLEENFVSKVKGRWADMLKYLTHKNREEKHQYDDSEVVSNFEWTTAREEKSDKEKVAEFLRLIDTEELREYNIDKYLTIEEYNKFRKHIENGFKYVQNKLSERVDRKMEVIFITGKSGTGKTTYAKRLCSNKGYSYYVSDGGKNPLDGYKGQDAIILDDLRASDYKYSELLKMLDNNTSSNVACRYYNKSMAWCKLIIITSVMPIDEWYKALQEYENEPLVQLKRRCKTYVDMDLTTMEIRLFSQKLNDYPLTGYVVENPIYAEFCNEEQNEEQELAFIESMFGTVIRQEETDDFEPIQETIPF